MRRLYFYSKKRTCLSFVVSPSSENCPRSLRWNDFIPCRRRRRLNPKLKRNINAQEKNVTKI